MEPASALTTAAFAAATIIPGCPIVEVWLKNWENKTQKKFEFCRLKKISLRLIAEKPSFIQIEPGNKNLDVKVDLNLSQTQAFDRIRLVPFSNDDPQNYFDLQFMHYPRRSAFQVSCVHTTHNAGINGVHHLKTLLDQHIAWEISNTPKHIFIEIGGSIEQEDLSNSSFKLECAMFKLEKLT